MLRCLYAARFSRDSALIGLYFDENRLGIEELQVSAQKFLDRGIPRLLQTQ